MTAELLRGAACFLAVVGVTLIVGEVTDSAVAAVVVWLLSLVAVLVVFGKDSEL